MTRKLWKWDLQWELWCLFWNQSAIKGHWYGAGDWWGYGVPHGHIHTRISPYTTNIFLKLSCNINSIFKVKSNQDRYTGLRCTGCNMAEGIFPLTNSATMANWCHIPLKYKPPIYNTFSILPFIYVRQHVEENGRWVLRGYHMCVTGCDLAVIGGDRRPWEAKVVTG